MTGRPAIRLVRLFSKLVGLAMILHGVGMLI